MSEWKLVPVEPTEEIRDAVCRAKNLTQRGPYALMTNAELDGIYRAAIAAAPPAPSAVPVQTIIAQPSDEQASLSPGAYQVLTSAVRPSAEPVEVYNPWRESLENCINGDNYLKATEYLSLIEELDDLYRFRAATTPAPSAEPVAWITVEEDGTRHGLREWRDGTHREVPLYTSPPAPSAEPVVTDAMVEAAHSYVRSELRGVSLPDEYMRGILRAALEGKR